MYVKFRYAALSIVLLSSMAASHANAQSHVGTTSLAQGIIYKCPNNHTLDVFGDEDSPNGLSGSVDNKAAMPMMAEFHNELPTGAVNTVVFGKQAEKNGVILEQEEARTQPGGDHGVHISYIEHGVEVWSYASCHAE